MPTYNKNSFCIFVLFDWSVNIKASRNISLNLKNIFNQNKFDYTVFLTVLTMKMVIMFPKKYVCRWANGIKQGAHSAQTILWIQDDVKEKISKFSGSTWLPMSQVQALQSPPLESMKRIDRLSLRNHI